MSYIFNAFTDKKNIVKSMLLFVGCLVGMIVVAPTKAEAIIENGAGIPLAIAFPDQHEHGFNYCNGWNPDGNNHAQGRWLSQRGNSNLFGPINLGENQNAVNLQVNVASLVCNRNIDSSGNIINRNLLRTLSYYTAGAEGSIIGRPDIPISVAGISPGTTQNIQIYDCSNFYNFRFIKQCVSGPQSADVNAPPVNNPITVSGLQALPEGGTYTLRVRVHQRVVNEFSLPSNPFAREYRCVADGRVTNGFGLLPPCPISSFNIDIIVWVPYSEVGTFTAEPHAAVPQLDADDNPTQATFRGSITVQGVSRVNNLKVSRRLFIDRITGPNIDLTPSPSDQDSSRNIVGTYNFVEHTLNLPAGLVPGDQICMTAVVDPSAGGVTADGVITRETAGRRESSRQCVSIANKPYFKVYGGDVQVGKGAGGVVCETDSTAGIVGWTRQVGTQYTGAGGQLAAFALGQIEEYATGQALASNNPKRLTFANSDGIVPGRPFGGGLDANAMSCSEDYWRGADTVIDTPGPNLNATDTGIYKVNGPYLLNTQGDNDLTGRQRITIYVDGDVYINSNITYQSTSYSSIDDIPSFRLIARGNIGIDPNVDTLNGLFVALPKADGSGGGTFYSCAKYQLSTPTHVAPPINEWLTTGGGCYWTPLTVYGAVIANAIKLNRTGGTLSDSTTGELTDYIGSSGGRPAEKFIFTPELWLTGAFRPGGGVDSIRTLPPVL